MNKDTLITAFKAAFDGQLSAKASNREAIAAFLFDKATIIVDDLPYPLDKQGFFDHHDFHEAGLWDKRALALIDLTADLYDTSDGKAGIVFARYNFRGKPKNAGFRQRPGHLSATCVWTGEKWQALNLHFSPLFAQVLDASPG